MAAAVRLTTTVLPVFVMNKNLPTFSDKLYTVNEICSACEKKTGHDSILGAQKIGALWRIYPKQSDARVKLLIEGFSLRGVSVTVCDKNPFVVMTRDGEREIKTTKVTVGNLPISLSNQDINAMLTKLGVKPRSELFMERARDENGGLTRWLTGRRFMYVEVPDRPLTERVSLGVFTASIFHQEQKAARNPHNTSCGRCLQLGHDTPTCPNDVICRECGNPGHKRGDPACGPLRVDETAAQEPVIGTEVVEDTAAQTNPDGDDSQPPSEGNSTSQAIAVPKQVPLHNSTKANTRKGRTHQATLPFERSRSLSTKRDRESLDHENSANKLKRLDCGAATKAVCDQDRDDPERDTHREENTPASVWG